MTADDRSLDLLDVGIGQESASQSLRILFHFLFFFWNHKELSCAKNHVESDTFLLWMI